MSRTKPEIVDLSMDGDDDFPPQGSTASVVAAAASTPPDVGGPRRSARDSKSTVVWIDGYAVKKTNNYSVTEGEYIYHDNDLYDTVSPSQKRRAAAALAAKKKPKTTPQPRQVSPQEIARTEHNNAVKKAKNEKQGVRRAFLSQNCEILKPFVEDSVYQELVAEKGLATVHPFQSQEVAQPLLVTGGVMRDYQIDGLNFLWNHHRRNLGMILGDEMGLGKTVQTISLLCRLKEETEEKQGPSLVVCPLSVLSSWMKELAFWAPSLKVFRLHNSSSSGQELARRAMMDSFVDFDVILTTYEMVKTPHLKSLYSRLHFRYLVLDEGHKVKCSETLVAAAVRKVHCENRLILTGTPLQNNMVELFNLLELLHPDVFTTTQPFESCFNLKENHVEKEMLLKAKNLLDLFMIRRLKSRVEKLLPARLETQVYCPLSKDQAFLYKAILLKDASVLDRVDRSDDEHMSHANRIILQNLFMQLRKASQHPWMFDGMRSSDATLQDMVAASGKLAVLDMLLRSLYKKGHRVVIFSQFTSTLDILEEYCYARGWKNCRLDGGVARAARDFVVRRFQDTDSQLFLFLMSTKSGGVGLNLQAADTCIIYDSDWNPQNDLQAMARVHRIGQTKVVHVYRLISSGSVEERMIERASKKLLLDQSVNRETSSGGNTGGLAAKDLLNDIKFGASAIFGGKTLEDLPSWKDIEHITNRDRKESDSVGKLKGGTEYNGATFKAENKFTEGQVFKGLDFRKIREENERKTLKETPKTLQGIGRLWQSIKAMEGKKREKKSRLIMVEGKGSGYGKEFVPVLASNNYDLLKGESSVFGRELKSSQRKHAALPSKKEKFENASHCQFCLDGGLLYCCQYCPVALHLNCCGINNPKDFKHCFHHHCSGCNKNTQEVGGLLFRCAICPWAWCESCVPTGKDVRYLDSHERWDELGYNSSKNAIYIHCSAECERYAKKEFNWKPEVSKVCPDSLDLSYNFGAPKVDVESKPTAREVSSSSSFSSDEGGLSNSSSENDNVISLV